MFGNNVPPWTDLVVETGAVPLPVSDADFRSWMTGRAVFVSSPMDAELRGARDAIRDWLTQWGGIPVMWETITPRDERASVAFLAGVDRSAVFVLMLGSSYGAADDTGYSPTHQEYNHATAKHLPRLLFTRAGVTTNERDGKLNRWIQELYNEVSGASFGSSDDLCSALERRLREMAGTQESFWLKLGPVVFPGHIEQRRTAREGIFTVTARVRDPAVRRTLSGLTGTFGSARADRLSWGTESERITVQDVTVGTTRSSESVVTITCAQSDSLRLSGTGGIPMTISGADRRSYGPADQALQWARTTVFGELRNANRSRPDMLDTFESHSGPDLPDVLRAHSASGWLAEGLTRLFLVEHLLGRHGGRFDRLEVGPATANGVRVDALFVPDGGSAVATIHGLVPLR